MSTKVRRGHGKQYFKGLQVERVLSNKDILLTGEQRETLIAILQAHGTVLKGHHFYDATLLQTNRVLNKRTGVRRQELIAYSAVVPKRRGKEHNGK